MHKNRPQIYQGKAESIEMLQRLTGLCSQREEREKEETSDDVTCFCFLSERDCHWDRQAWVCVCVWAASLNIWEFIFFQHSLITPLPLKQLVEWGKEPSWSHRKFTLQLRLAGNRYLHNLFFLNCWKRGEMSGSVGALQTHLSAWQPQLNIIPLHICSQLQLEELQQERQVQK